jgi:hypothetical protein
VNFADYHVMLRGNAGQNIFTENKWVVLFMPTL